MCSRCSGPAAFFGSCCLVALSLLSAPAHAQFLPGDILVNGFASSSIQQYRPNGILVRTFTGTGRGWEGDSLTPTGSLVTTFNSPGPGIDLFNAAGSQTNTFGTGNTFAKPGDVSVFADGTLAVSAQDGASVHYYSQSGVMLKTVPLAGAVSPFGNTVAPDNTLYVADFDGKRIYHVNEAGSTLGSFSTDFTPGDVVVAADGTLYVSDVKNVEVKHLSAAGAVLNKFSIEPLNPIGIGFAPDGNSLYVSGQTTPIVFHYSLTGTLLDQFALSGSFTPDFLTVVPNAPPPSVPEPGSIALLASFGLTGAAFLARRRKTGA